MEDERPVTGWLTADERREVIFGVLSKIDFAKAKRALEQAAKSKLVADFAQFITNFSLEKVLRGLILKTAEDRLQSGELNEDDAKHLLNERDEFLSYFDAIMGWDNSEHRQVALTVILSTFAIALHGHAKKDLIHQLTSTLGELSGETRREEAEEGWRHHALELAIAIRREDKAVTQVNLKAKIKSRWKLRIHCPESMLIPAISEWEREGRLPRRHK